MLNHIRHRTTGRSRGWGWAVPMAAAAFILASAGGAFASSTAGSSVTRATTPAAASWFGPNEYGMTRGSYAGQSGTFVYTHGFSCDRHVAAVSANGCEAGEAAAVPPAAGSDPVIITVPLVFDGQDMDCPADLTCVDQPANLDMTRLAAAFAPFARTTTAVLMPRLRNVTMPGYDLFIPGKNAGASQWRDVRVVAVTDPATYRAIQQHHSWSYLQRLLQAKDKHVVGPFPTNVSLYFAAH